MTPFEQHCQRWRNGCGASICSGARKCFARGVLPCDLLFIGEGPGESENVTGKPFIGPAGKLLDQIIERAMPVNGQGQAPIRIALTNIVMCIPRNHEDGGKAEEPADHDIRKCRPRLEELIRISSPQVIICVGKLAADWCNQKRPMRDRLKLPEQSPPIPIVEIVHPAFILRLNSAHQGLAIQKSVVTIASAVEEYVLPF